MIFRLVAFALLLMSAPVAAQMVKSTFMSLNGTEVSVSSDDFAERYEYTAPTIDFPELSGFALVATIKEGGQVRGPIVVGSVSYRGEWRRYYTAILKGGEEVESSFNDRDVVSCRGSRYSGCSLREGFELKPTAQQISEYSEDGVLKIQLRAQSGQAVLVSVPVSYFDAVIEAAQ